MTGTPPVVPDHRLLRCIGGGSYGDVWLAVSLTGRLRAVKIIRRRLARSSAAGGQELEGVKAGEPVSRSHPHIMPILHVGWSAEERFYYYIMEPADALPDSYPPDRSHAPQPDDEPALSRYEPWTLQAMLRKRGRLPADEAVSIALKLAAALAHMHGRGILHRDVKPANIVFRHAEPCLADLGLAAAGESDAEGIGTDGYRPAEGSGTPQADVYALGKILYEMTTGLDRTRFPEAPAGFAAWPERRRLLDLDPVIHRACSPEAASRYASANAFADDLRRWQQGRAPRLARRELLAAALLVPAGAAAWYFLIRQSPDAEMDPVTGLTEAEKAQGFIALASGRDFAGWELEKGGRVTAAADIAGSGAWRVENGAYVRTGPGGNLQTITPLPSVDFELRFEWRAGAGTDSGLIYGADLFQYQCGDDNLPGPSREPHLRSGALFQCDGPAGFPARPAGEWNEARIVAVGSRVEHWLNGQTALGVELDAPEFQGSWQRYVRYRRSMNRPEPQPVMRAGRIMLQNLPEASGIAFRRLRWRAR